MSVQELFDEHGNLPIGTCEMDVKQFFEVFVHGYPNSITRKKIALGFAQFLLDVLAIFDEFEIWADGSYTTSKQDPDDIDTVTKYHSNQYTQLTPAERTKTFGMFNGEDTADEYGVDSYALVVYDSDHEGYQSFLDERNRRTKDFTYDDRTEKYKGLVVMHMNQSKVDFLQQFLKAGGDLN
ncbi:MAG: DUF6932 family protein [Tumebacillaceae bacterium]